MPYLIRIVGEHKLYKLSVIFMNVDSHNSTIVILVRTIHSFEIEPIFEIEEFQANYYEFEESFKIIWRRSGNENIAEPHLNSSG